MQRRDALQALVANAIRHTRSGHAGGAFTVEACHWFAGVAVAVADQGGASEPVPGDADALAESGRGLRTVSALADGWGWYGNATGRAVIAVFQAAPAVAIGVVAAGAA
ncbi:hypothetical protein GCM10023196_038530 [Actinoallomurus vinaceus]|uniref:Histidine kinase/HSP90-like ATPase domain-containing protein n=1 Tax=Actinoallomurus vinaceus TaxID=1080074 RepID=A0ABP8UBL5_9ACTN